MNQSKTTTRSRLIKTGTLAILLGCLPFFLSACRLWTVVPLRQDVSKEQGIKVYFENDNFNADKYVNNIWESKVMLYFEKKATAADRLWADFRKDSDAAGQKYGIRASEEGSPWNFIMKGTGKIIAVNTTSRAGTVELDLPPYDNQKDFIIQIGPVIKGSSIRDSLDFISFDDFENQIVFAQLSNTFNKRIYDRLLSKTDFTKLKDREVDFTGAFTADGSGDVLVTPVLIKVR